MNLSLLLRDVAECWTLWNELLQTPELDTALPLQLSLPETLVLGKR
jgi:hypothetical protein